MQSNKVDMPYIRLPLNHSFEMKHENLIEFKERWEARNYRAKEGKEKN
jgi:hypothetical protein